MSSVFSRKAVKRKWWTLLVEDKIYFYKSTQTPPALSWPLWKVTLKFHEQSGVLELNLIAQDLTAYGYDLKPRSNLTHLLEALAAVEGIRWIRLMYAYPRSFPKGLVDLMAREEKIVPYLDMP